MPFEAILETNNVEFYTQDLNGQSIPNDDLDLQLVWLGAMENHGVYHLTPRLLGEYWMSCIIGPWSEYSVCKSNIANGLYPPLSGACNNEVWKFSNGAWIRSEIWACIFPGMPDEAIRFADMDACADHYGEGIYAEIFTVALQSTAFVVTELETLIEIALTKIPPDCMVSRCVRQVCDLHRQGLGWLENREKIFREYDVTVYRAPVNLAFLAIALLYGEDDFGRTICLAVNCGDDTDCTAATAGALWGIRHGYKRIPEKWLKPIGMQISTYALDPFGLWHAAPIPANLEELTERVIKQTVQAWRDNPSLYSISDQPTIISESVVDELLSTVSAEKIWKRPVFQQEFDLGYARLIVIYEKGPVMEPGESQQITLEIRQFFNREGMVFFQWHPPVGWKISPDQGGILAKSIWDTRLTMTCQAGEFSGCLEYIPLKIRLNGRQNPICLHIPFQQAGSIACQNEKPFDSEFGQLCRRNRLKREQKKV